MTSLPTEWTSAAASLLFPPVGALGAANSDAATGGLAQKAGFIASGQAVPRAVFAASASGVGFSARGSGFGDAPSPMAHPGISEADTALVMDEARASRLLAVSADLNQG